MSMDNRKCGNCIHANSSGERMKCGLIEEQRSCIVGPDGSVSADDFCPQHDFAEAA